MAATALTLDQYRALAADARCTAHDPRGRGDPRAARKCAQRGSHEPPFVKEAKALVRGTASKQRLRSMR